MMVYNNKQKNKICRVVANDKLKNGQRKAIDTIQCKIDIDESQGWMSHKFRNIISLVNFYNNSNTKYYLDNLDNALDNYGKIHRFFHKEEANKVDRIESQMPSERQRVYVDKSGATFDRTLTNAGTMVDQALVNINTDSYFNRYFRPTRGEGKSVDPSHRDMVCEVYNKIKNVLVAETKPIGSNDFSERTYVYAHVDSGDLNHTINLCSLYQTAKESGPNSKSGILIHEISHFSDVGGTEDYAYGRDIFRLWGHRARKNAETYEYAAEGVPR